jgi:heme exporter protein CcmD
MSEIAGMDKYGVYVWSCYGLFALMLLWDAFAPHLRTRRFLRELSRRQQREAARKST